MIRQWLIMVAVLAVGAAAAYYLHDETGYVLVSFHGWILETSLLGLVLAVGMSVVGSWLLLRLIIGGVQLPAALRGMAERRRRDRAQRSFETGTLHLLEGDWKRAEIELVRRAADHHAGHLNYLSAARAAQRMGAGERRDHYLHLATRVAPALERATLLTQARLQLERGEFALARDVAQRLRALEPKHLLSVELQAEALFGLADWEALRQLLVSDIGTAGVPAPRRRQMLARALVARLREAETSARLDQLKALWGDTPNDARQWPEVRLQHARSLARLNAQPEAMALATAVLNKEWDGGLVTLYGELETGDTIGQLAAIEQWLGKYGERTELLMAAGRVCLRNRLWGKARSYLDAVESTAPSAAVYLELAKVCEQSQNPVEAQTFYRRGLELAANDR
jgi:HemY protein